MDQRDGVGAAVNARPRRVRPSAVLLLTALGLGVGLALLPDYWDWDLHRLREVIVRSARWTAEIHGAPLAMEWERWRGERERAKARAETLEKSRVTGSIDALFDGLVTHLAVQPDGKILAVGVHTMAGIGIARLRPDGSLDEEFVRRASWEHAGDLGGVPRHVEVAPDGGVIVSGSLNFRGAPHARIRFHPDGTLDTPGLSKAAAGPVSGAETLPVPGWAAELLGGLQTRNVTQSLEDHSFPYNVARVQFLALQPDGRALIARIRHGFFALIRGSQDGGWEETPVGGRVCATVSEGTVTVTALAFQRDGGIVMVGDLPRWRRGTHGCEHVAFWRIAPDGTFDESFRAMSASDLKGGMYGHAIRTVLVLSDGRIVIGGQFTSVQGRARRNIARFRADGFVDG